MKIDKLDVLIARYAEHRMSAAEEEDFFIMMALDSELRRRYQANCIVESALRKQRQWAPRPARMASAGMVAVRTTTPPQTRHVRAPRRPMVNSALLLLASVLVISIPVWISVMTQSVPEPGNTPGSATEIPAVAPLDVDAGAGVVGEDQSVAQVAEHLRNPTVEFPAKPDTARLHAARAIVRDSSAPPATTVELTNRADTGSARAPLPLEPVVSPDSIKIFVRVVPP